MHWYKTFFANIAILLTLTYLASLFNKYLLQGISRRNQSLLFIFAAILGGWVSMFFGLPLAEDVLFDLRFVPLIIAPMFVNSSSCYLLIGAGIGLSRLTFSPTAAASWVGLLNMVILGLVAAALHEVLKSRSYSSLQKNLIFLFVINVLNVVVITAFGVIPAWEYLTHIAPLTFPMSILLSLFFSLLVRDFQMDSRRQVNLREANRELAVQYEISQQQTAELEETTAALEEHTRMLQLSNQYKSEFLANMSHELRTPLNSMLILSQLLAENRNKTLPPEEVSYAEMIHSSGKDLLRLINDILDFSKVEAGRLELIREPVNLNELPSILERTFHPLAQQKELAFQIQLDSGLPDIIGTDGQRLHQILTNLLSNAFKFTEKGMVTLSLRRCEQNEVVEAFRLQTERMPEGLPDLSAFGALFEPIQNWGRLPEGGRLLPLSSAAGAAAKSSLPLEEPGAAESTGTGPPPADREASRQAASEWLAFTVEDTGIGIPKEKHSFVFEAFRQADGTTSRKYGGTGLGLSISREFAKLLGGFIQLDSEVGCGSRFTLYLPYSPEPKGD
ncbi:ATP-binding protein [Gorillibacterium sp. CAU 1737]|uniref:sensor histidine kinase n=1 Tax=Gorillibacterium sp. CAU 1737 TaxID=3140362 RepID=UPI00326058A2